MSEHAKLSPSSAHRWLHCPGSVALEDDRFALLAKAWSIADEGTVPLAWASATLAAHEKK